MNNFENNKASKILRKFDIFGINYLFRVNNNDKHRSAFGGIMTILVFSFCIFFTIQKILDFLKNEDLQIQYIEKFEKVHFEFTPENLHLSLTFKYFDYENFLMHEVKGSVYEKYFAIEMLHIIRHRNGTKQSNEITQMNCNKINLTYNFPEGETYNFLKDHYCFDIPPTHIYGQYSDLVMSYIQVNLSLNPEFLLNVTSYKEIQNAIESNAFEINIYYSSKMVDVSNFEKPITKRIDTLSYNFVDWTNPVIELFL